MGNEAHWLEVMVVSAIGGTEGIEEKKDPPMSCHEFLGIEK